MKAMRPNRDPMRDALLAQGWYMHVEPQSPEQRARRESRVVMFYYVDTVQRIVEELRVTEATGEALDKIAAIPFVCLLCQKVPCVCEPSS